MTRWLIAAIIGLMIAALHYGRSLVRPNGAGTGTGASLLGVDARALAAFLRAAAATLVAAMLLGAPAAPSRPRHPLIALDASASWTRGDRPGARWARALDSARALAAGDTLWLFGDSVRASRAAPHAPVDAHSTLGPMLEMARDQSRALVVVTDGELSNGGSLPAGTRLTVLPAPPAVDAGLVSVVAQVRAAPGDTVPVRVTLRTGALPVNEATVTVAFAGGSPVVARTGPVAAFSDRELSARLVAPRAEGEELLRATLAVAGDVEPRNDTLATIVEVTRVPSAVLVSSSPDPDARAVLEVLSGALVAPPHGYYQVAPGAWRDASTLRTVNVGDVRSAAAAAPLLVLHGDSMIFGAPARSARGALVLMVPGDAADAEWRAASGDASPLSSSLAGISWDSLPPIEIATAPPTGDWVALSARSPGLASRAVVAGGEVAGRKRLVVAASGLWRWRARGGPARDAFDALWGAIADWTTSAAVDARAVLPEKRWFRAEERITWRRTGADSLVALQIRADAAPVADSAGRGVALHFSGDDRGATTPPLPPGRYTATMRGGVASFVVNAGTELLPARAVSPAVAGGAPPRGVPAPPLRERWWAYVLVIASLCAEWIIRRRAGLR